MYTLKLYDGRELAEVVQNGSMLSTTAQITRKDLAEGVQHVVISGKPDNENDTDYSGEFSGMKVAFYQDLGTRRDFVLTLQSSAEAEAERDRADIEYIAMMSGIQL